MSTHHTTAVISLGGTISMAGSDRLDFGEYMYSSKSIDLESKVADLARLYTGQRLRYISLLSKPSHDLTGSDWIALAKALNNLLSQEDIDSAVVCHGTNTMEETAFFLELVMTSRKPIVLVGSMRPDGVLASDVESNIVDALRLVQSSQAALIGVVVCMGGTVFASADVTKTNTRSIHGFSAPRMGSVGSIEPDGRVFIGRQGPRRLPIIEDLQSLSALARVDLVTSHIDADGSLIRASHAAGATGIVSAGTGAGFPTQYERDALTEAARNGVVVCQGSRCSAAYVAAPTRTAGDDSPFLWAAHLLSWQARTLLSVALVRTRDPLILQAMIDDR